MSSIGAPEKIFYKDEDKVCAFIIQLLLYILSLLDAHSLTIPEQAPCIKNIRLFLQLFHPWIGMYYY